MKDLFLFLRILPPALLLFFLLFPLLIFGLARHNLFFTLIKENEGKLITAGKSLWKILINSRVYFLDKTIWEVQEINEPEQEIKEPELDFPASKKPKKSKKLKRPKRRLGIFWVGIWPFWRVHIYKFRWETIKEGKPEQREELFQSFSVKRHGYYFNLEEIECSGLIPLDIGVYLTIRIVNPYKAIFLNHQWFELMRGRLGPHIREFISQKTFDDLIKIPQLPGGELHNFLSDIFSIIKDELGLEIHSLELFSIGIAKKYAERYENILTKKWEAEQEAARIETVFSQIKEYGDLGLTLRNLETLAEAANGQGKIIIWPGLPGIENILEKISRKGQIPKDVKTSIGDIIKDFFSEGGKK